MRFSRSVTCFRSGSAGTGSVTTGSTGLGGAGAAGAGGAGAGVGAGGAAEPEHDGLIGRVGVAAGFGPPAAASPFLCSSTVMVVTNDSSLTLATPPNVYDTRMAYLVPGDRPAMVVRPPPSSGGVPSHVYHITSEKAAYCTATPTAPAGATTSTVMVVDDRVHVTVTAAGAAVGNRGTRTP